LTNQEYEIVIDEDDMDEESLLKSFKRSVDLGIDKKHIKKISKILNNTKSDYDPIDDINIPDFSKRKVFKD